MSVVSRDIAAIPVRTSTDTWDEIVDLLASPGSEARARLDAIANVAGILITCEYTRQAPIVVMPAVGARVRIRTVHGTDALAALTDEIPLAVRPCDQPGWTLSLPCGIDDIDEISAAIEDMPDIDVRDVTEGITASATGEAALSEWSIDYNELEHP